MSATPLLTQHRGLQQQSDDQPQIAKMQDRDCRRSNRMVAMPAKQAHGIEHARYQCRCAGPRTHARDAVAYQVDQQRGDCETVEYGHRSDFERRAPVGQKPIGRIRYRPPAHDRDQQQIGIDTDARAAFGKRECPAESLISTCIAKLSYRAKALR